MPVSLEQQHAVARALAPALACSMHVTVRPHALSLPPGTAPSHELLKIWNDREAVRGRAIHM